MILPAKIQYQSREFEIDLGSPIDISIPVGRFSGPNAFYLPKPEYTTVEDGGFVGDMNRGGSCNVENIFFSPHGNGTHTECNGHVHKDHHLIYRLLKRHFFLACLITVTPESIGPDKIVNRKLISDVWPGNTMAPEAVIIRTNPNSIDKKTSVYGGTNPPYIAADAVQFLNEKNILHLIIDLPSVDKEDDNKLSAHHLFFDDEKYRSEPKTITEMIYAGNEIPDGLYWLDLQVAGFESDAGPSKPVLYEIVSR